MSRSGVVCFYSTLEMDRPVEVINNILEINGASKVYLVSRSTQADDEWNRFRQGQEQADDELLGKGIASQDAAAMYQPGRCLSLDVGRSHWGDELGKEVEKNIPEDVRGDFLPCQLLIQCGFHDLFECAEHEGGLFFARAFFSVSFFGYGSPDLWPETREAILSLPMIAKIRQSLQKMCGDEVDVIVFWYP